MKWRLGIGLLLGLALAQAAPAQRPLRPLGGPGTAAWTHKASGLVLPATIEGSQRVSIGDSGTEELDISAQFEDADGLTTTLYLFRSQIPSVPLWFDRARTVLEQLRLSQSEPAPPGTSLAFALPGGKAASAMRAAYPFATNGFRSTAVALASANGWLVKVRMSSKKLDTLQLDTKLAAFVNAIRWPADARAAAAAEPIVPCADRLALSAAKIQKPDMAQAMLGSLMAMAGSKVPTPSARYCREANQGIPYSIYRPIGTRDRYLMAIADSGRVISVGGSPVLDPKKKSSYGVTLLDLGQSATYASFDRLPEPGQVLQLIQSGPPLSSTKLGSNRISVSSDAKR